MLADNDFSSLKSLLVRRARRAPPTPTATDRLLRDGLDAFLGIAGDALQKAGKMLVPNVSESHLRPGRWTAHSRYDGAMEENFGLRDDGGTGELLTFRGNEWKELRAQAALGESWLLLITHTRRTRARNASGTPPPRCSPGRTPAGTARQPRLQEPGVVAVPGGGARRGGRDRQPAAQRRVDPSSISNGWVAVNPTSKAAQVASPAGLVDINGVAVPSPLELPAADAMVLVKPKVPGVTTTPPVKPPTIPTTTTTVKPPTLPTTPSTPVKPSTTTTPPVPNPVG